MKRHAAFVMWCGLLFMSRAAVADLTATIVDTNALNGPGFDAVQTAAGGTFNIVIHLSTTSGLTNNLVSGQFKIQDLSSSGFFTLTARSFNDGNSDTDPPYEWSNDPGDELAFSSETLAPLSSDIGTLTEDPSVSGTGTEVPLVTGLDFAYVTVSVSGAATPGTYTLNLADLVFGDTTFDAVADVSAGPDYTVIIASPVPAPGAWLIGAVGLGMVGWVKKRSQRNKRPASSNPYGY